MTNYEEYYQKEHFPGTILDTVVYLIQFVYFPFLPGTL
jgi:hypothetical protein